MLTILYAITIISVLTSAGFAVAGLVRPTFVAPGQQIESSRIFALYTFARAIPVARGNDLGLSGRCDLAQRPCRAYPIVRRLCRDAVKELPHDLGTYRHRGGAVCSACLGGLRTGLRYFKLRHNLIIASPRGSGEAKVNSAKAISACSVGCSRVTLVLFRTRRPHLLSASSTHLRVASEKALASSWKNSRNPCSTTLFFGEASDAISCIPMI